MLSGEAHTWYGDRLEQPCRRAGRRDVLHPGRRAAPAGQSFRSAPCTAVIARTDPNEQESVVLLPELDALVC